MKSNECYIRNTVSAFVFLFIFLCVNCITDVYANNRNVLLKGVLCDKENGIPIEYATIQVYSLPDSLQTGGGLSGINGVISVPLYKTGKYFARISYIGYKTLEIPIEYKSISEKEISVGTLNMVADAIMLEEAVIIAEAPQVQVAEDTVVYNASAFKVTEGAVLEELIEKLPGAEIDENGKIMINGQELNKIMVNGKEFFGGDILTGLQNLPVEMIEQLKTYNKESDMKKLTGIDDGDDEVVLDVKIKKEKNDMWFGNANVAGGTDRRYTSKIMVNRFADESQYSLIASANNVTDKGFSSSARPNWRTNKGVSHSQNAGANIDLKKEKAEIDGNVKFRRSGNDTRGNQTSERFDIGNTTFTNSSSDNRSGSYELRSNFKIEFNPNEKTSIVIRPNISYIKGSNIQNNSSYTLGNREFTDSINSSKSDSYTKFSRKNANVSFLINRKLSEHGRNIGLRLGIGYSDSHNNRWRDNITHYYKIFDNNGNDSINHRYQLVTNDSRNNDYTAQVTYSEPLFNVGFLQLSYQFVYKNSVSDKTTYDLINELELDSLGKYAEYDYYNHDVSLSYKVVRPKYRLSMGFSLLPQRSVLSYEYLNKAIDTVRTVFIFAPKMEFRYKFSKVSQIKLNYRGRSSQPGIESLLPVVDNSDPLNIRVGNPGLAPSFTHTIRLNANTYNRERQRSIIINGGVNLVQNSISNSTAYNEETGGRVTTPMNINGNWNGNISLGFNTALKNKKFTIHSNVSANYRNSVGYLYNSDIKSTMKNSVSESRFGGSLSGSFRNSNMEIALNSTLNYSFEKDEHRTENNQEPYNYSYGASATFFLPWKMSMSTNIVNQCRRGYSDSNFNRNELIWNAKFSKTLFRGNSIISVEAYDILRQKSNITRSVSSNNRVIGEFNGINSYFLMHFTYKFNI